MVLVLGKETSPSAARLRLFNRPLSISSLPSANLYQTAQVPYTLQPPKDPFILLQVRPSLLPIQAP